jgi:glycosyltransferase involved in cell wall biosynthesis
MRVGVDASSLLGQSPRGEGNALLCLYAELARVRPEWSFVFFGALHGGGEESLRQAVPGAEIIVRDVPGYRWNLWEQASLPLQALRRRLDVLHSFSSGGPRWCPRPLVMTVHDVIPLLFDDGSPLGARDRFRNRLVAGLRRADVVVTVSEHTRGDLCRLFPWVPHTRIRVVHWGAPDSPNMGSEDPQALDRQHVLLFGGGGARRKNVVGAVRMFRQVATCHSKVRLVIVGATNETERQSVEAEVQSLGLQGRVDVSGFLSEPELDRLYRSAACLVYPSLYEGFGLPPLEAMARGVPVVASDRSSIPEVVGGAGLLVDPEDHGAMARAVMTLLQDEGRRAALVRAGLERARAFSWKTCAEKMASVLESTAYRRGGRHFVTKMPSR